MAALGALVLSGCGGSVLSQPSGSSRIVTFAEQPSAPPNYIFPLESGAYFTFANGQFSPLMYLPLYSFGNGKSPTLNNSLSLAHPPVFTDHNTVVSVTLKHWKWSDGAPVTARDIIFWVNMLSAATDPNAPAVGSNSAPGPGWGASSPGGFPENVVAYSQSGTYSVVFHLNTSYNPTWFLYNELSQIYPCPTASWDQLSTSGPVGNYDASAEARVTLPGKSPSQYVPKSPGTATSGALGVAQFLNSQSQTLGTYATNPLWRVVDGPFKLSQFTTSGYAKLLPNPGYSGTPKVRIKAFEELPFTSADAEFDALHTGNLTIGYIPTQDVASQKSELDRQEKYSYDPWYTFAFNALDFNFTNPIVGPLLEQLYLRQAFQSLINQTQYINDFNAGIGSVTNGPVPSYPPRNTDESPLESKGEVYPYDPAKAVDLLEANGWHVAAGGVSYCLKPGTGAGECGAGVKANQQLTFAMLYPSGSAGLTSEMAAMQSTMKQHAGINLQLKEEPVNQVTAVISAGCTSSSPCSDWELGTEANTGVSWVYLPDYFPTGEELFLAGADSNQGDYDSAKAATLIDATNTAPNSAAETRALFKYEDYIARQLPVAWLPTSPYQLTMYKKALKGLVPQGIFSQLVPQDYTFAG